jgi:hypothetical protein
MAYASSEKDNYPAEWSDGAPGIIFHLAIRRRYIPYGWLLHVEINRDETEIQFHFTHSIVIVTGTKLETLYDWASKSKLGAVRESAPFTMTTQYPIVRRIEITDKTGD